MESKLFRLKRIKSQLWRMFPVVFLFLSAVLIVLTLMGNPFIAWVKEESVGVFTPVVSVLSQPVYWIKRWENYLHDWVKTYHENERLKSENEYLIKWRSLALELFLEQKELKEYLNYIPPPKTRHLMAEIALDEGSAFTRSFVVSAGSEQGVSKGMLAFSPKGLFARVVEVMPNYSRIMALTDYMSRVPVWVGENKIPALLMGDNTSSPFLQFLNEDEKVQKGDIVITSGYVGVYPAGLAIGFIDEIHEDEVRVRPFENGERLFYVRLVDFGISTSLLKEVK